MKSKYTEFEKAFLEIKRVIKAEFFNFYLVYRKIKKSYLGGFSEKKFEKVLKLCKKYQLHCVYKKFTYINKHKKRRETGYSCMISHDGGVPKNIFSLKGKRLYNAIGLTIGYPKTCVKTFGNRKNHYGHDIEVKYKLKGDDRKHRIHDQLYYFMCNRPLTKHMKNFKKAVVEECKKNLLNLFSYLSIRYEITNYDFSKEYSITKVMSHGTSILVGGKSSQKIKS